MKAINADFTFYHIEKCAGSSLRTILNEYFLNIYKKDEIIIPGTKYGNKNINLMEKYHEELIKIYDFSKIKVVLSHMYYENMYINTSKFKFTCVRNPVDRVISHYYFFDYKYYNKHLNELTDSELDKVLKKNCIVHKLSTNRSRDLNQAKENSKKFDYIMIYENFNNDLKELNILLNNRFECDIDMKIHIDNKTSLNYKKYITTNLKKK